MRKESRRRGMMAPPEKKTRTITIFVSSPNDVAEERAVLEEAVQRINRMFVRSRNLRLEIETWGKNVVPKIGPKPQQVVDEQIPSDYDVYLGIMKHRFGTPAGRYGSGTEKEFNDALKRWGKMGSPWILFYFGKFKIDPAELDLDQYAKVRQFIEKLEKKGLYATYEGVRGSSESFFEKVEMHLCQILDLLAPPQPGQEAKPLADPASYLRDVFDKTGFIDIRGLAVGQERAHRFPIEDLYMTLTATQAASAEAEESEKRMRKRSGQDPETAHALRESRALPLHEALRHERLLVVGDPGAGKTTFVRRVAHALCQTELGDVPDAAKSRLGIEDRTFPVLVRLNELGEHISVWRKEPSAPAGEDSPAWLPHFLARTSRDNSLGLEEQFFRGQLEDGRCTVLLDGLDEAADSLARKRLSRLIENIGGTYGGCRLVVTSRPAGLTDDVHLLDVRQGGSGPPGKDTPAFVRARIDPLSDEAVETFLARWCGALYKANPDAASTHCSDLLSAVKARAEIRRMARNPVMLTALAVVHWNERRLPEQRADLYDSIIRWLSRSREQRPGREKAERTVVLLQELALAMQDHPDGMRTEVPRRWAAVAIAGEWKSGVADKDSIASAERFLEAEEVDSGIVVGRGENVRFWHRTFQEFLAAKAIASRPDAEQQERLWKPAKSGLPRLYLPEWKEVVLLLAGLLHERGRATVDLLVKSMLDRAGSDASLAEQARCAGTIGAMLRDLEPVAYKVSDPKYEALHQRVMAIFDREKSQSVPVHTRIEAADALGQAGDPRIDHRKDDYWVPIPAGQFLMGAQSKNPDEPNYDPEAYEWEAPVHRVYLDAFRIARYPVTVEQYRQFVEHEGYEEERFWLAGGYGKFSAPDNWDEQLQYPSRPVVSVSWYEAAAYCEWAGFRLPTEAEWERAARGTEGRRYPWGNEDADPSRLNYSKSDINHPTPVGIYPLGATPDGIWDLAGNVDEWCADWYGKYSAKTVRNPSGPQEASIRVIRGGGWYDDSRDCRASDRDWIEPEDRSDDLGFRVAPVLLGGQVQASGSERSLERRPRGRNSGARPIGTKRKAE